MNLNRLIEIETKILKKSQDKKINSAIKIFSKKVTKKTLNFGICDT